MYNLETETSYLREPSTGVWDYSWGMAVFPVDAEFCAAKPAPTKPCGCYAKDEEIQIENDKCVLDLGSMPNITKDWKLEFEAKFESWYTNESGQRVGSQILSGIGHYTKAFFNSVKVLFDFNPYP